MNPIKKNHEAMLRTGAMALAAAGASTAAHAATVQITFNNSFISSTSGNHLVTDFGGDGVTDLVGGAFVRKAEVRVPANNQLIAFGSSSTDAYARVRGFVTVSSPSVAQVSEVASFTLVDGKVRGGASTPGWLDVTATGRVSGEKGRVEVWRFIFDDSGLGAPAGVAHADAAYPEYVAAAVPEPSGMGLLALGAGGLAARRRRAMAA